MSLVARTDVDPLVVGQAQQLILDPITLPGSRTLADWAAFVLTFRTAPEWPLSRDDRVANPDPVALGWPVVLTVSGAVDGTTVVFDMDETDSLNLVAGPIGRTAFDAWGTGGTAGDVQLVPPTWIEILPDLR